MNPLTSMIVASTVASALVGGVFFAFSVFVMRALTDLPPAQGILAMQRVNIPVINPLFLGVFLGSAALLGVTAYVGRSSEQRCDTRPLYRADGQRQTPTTGRRRSCRTFRRTTDPWWNSQAFPSPLNRRFERQTVPTSVCCWRYEAAAWRISICPPG